ncbi:MAG: ABC transporter permease [Isosphaeraceae bacterium]
MNRLGRACVLALRNLALYKLRSFLTALGLIFGVSSVVAMLAIAEGASLEAQKQIADLGATNVIIKSKKPVDEGPKAQRQGNESIVSSYGLTQKDFDRIRATLPTVRSVTPVREFRRTARYYDRSREVRLVGVDPDYLALTNQRVAQGRFFEDIDTARFANVAVLGAEIAEELFPYGNPVGKAVRVEESQYFRVIGVLAPKNASASAGGSLDSQDFGRDVYVPITTDRARFGEVLFSAKQGDLKFERVEFSQITVTVDDMKNVKRTAEALDSLLRQFHARKDYGITVPLELLEKAEATQRIFNLVLGSIASISLLVGGIGIMNIMLATVTERTREIGIRRAIGAKRRDIILQFLIETGVLSSTGGLIGVLLGLLVPPVVSSFSGLPAVVRPYSPIVALLIAVVTGVAFGVYPARRAAMMDPVEALRCE